MIAVGCWFVIVGCWFAAYCWFLYNSFAVEARLFFYLSLLFVVVISVLFACLLLFLCCWLPEHSKRVIGCHRCGGQGARREGCEHGYPSRTQEQEEEEEEQQPQRQ